MSTLIDTSHPAYERECPTCEQRKHAPCFDQRVHGTKHRATPHPARTAHLRWQRLDGGYMRADGEFFLMRGAPMSNGSTDSWLIHRRVTEDRVARDSSSAYDVSNGVVLWRVTEDGYCDTSPATDLDTPLYAHDWDAGSLAEAKATVAIVEAS